MTDTPGDVERLRVGLTREQGLRRGLERLCITLFEERDTARAERDRLAIRVGWLRCAFTAANKDRRFAWSELRRENQVAVEAQREVDELRTELASTRAQNNRRAGILLRLASELGDAPVRTEGGIPDAVAAVLAERDRLRAVVNVVRDAFVRPNDDEWKIEHGALVVLADALDALEATDG